MRRLLSIFCFLALTTSLCWAEVTDFERALDDWEFKQAHQALQTISDPSSKALCEAEYYVRKKRPEFALKVLETLQPTGLSGGQRGKFLLVKAYLERTRYEGTPSQRTSATMRLIRDGLRSSPSPRDRTKLLLLRIKVAPADKTALAEEAESELAELESVDDSLDLMAQAMLQVRKGRHAQAARLWGNLATIAKSQGKLKSQTFYQFKELEALRDAGKVETAQQIEKALFNRAVTEKDPFSARLFWNSQRSSSEEHKNEIAETLYDALEPSEAKLLFLSRLAYSGPDRETKIKLAERGVEGANLLQDPVLQAFFQWRAANYSGSRTKRDRVKSEIGEMLKGYNLEHLGGVWYASLRHFQNRDESISYHDLHLENFESALAASSKSQRHEVTRKYLDKAITSVKPVLAFPALNAYKESMNSVPAADRMTALNRVLRSFYFGSAYYTFNSPPGNRARGRRTLTTALLDNIKSDPPFIAALTDAYLASLYSERDPEKLAVIYKNLAKWMTLLERREEAADLLHLASALGVKSQQRPLLELELLLNRNSQPPLTSNQVKTLADLKMSDSSDTSDTWDIYCESGWLELYCDRASQAEMWAQKALAESAGVSVYEFLDGGPYRLLAHAKASLGQVDEALKLLEKAEVRYPRGRARYLLSRALILVEADRHEEAYISTLGIGRYVSLDQRILTQHLRSSSARATGREEVANQAETELAAFLEKEMNLSQAPQFSRYLRAEFANKPGEVERQSPTSEFRGLANVTERLEALRRREPSNQLLRRLGAAEIRGLTETANPDEIFVQPMLLEHSVVLLSAVQGDVCLQEVVCDRDKVEKALLSLSTKLSTPSIDVKHASADQKYLSRVLVKPWQSLFPQKTKLRWLGEEGLKSVPLSALPGVDGKPLVHRFSTAYLDGPGISTLKLSSKLSALVVGGADDLPGADRELKTVRKTFARGNEWTLGQKFETLKKFTGEHEVVHFATHGKAPSQKDLAASLSGSSSRLSAFQLAELTFPENSLAVLGACESYVDADTGRDNTSLVSALRTAGANVVVGSFWRLDDKVTAELFGHFYASLSKGAEPDAALALAQREVLGQQAHPYYWAGIQVVSGP